MGETFTAQEIAPRLRNSDSSARRQLSALLEQRVNSVSDADRIWNRAVVVRGENAAPDGRRTKDPAPRPRNSRRIKMTPRARLACPRTTLTAPRGSGWRATPNQSFVLRLYRRVTFAGRRAETVDVGDIDAPAAVADNIGLLQR